MSLFAPGKILALAFEKTIFMNAPGSRRCTRQGDVHVRPDAR